MRKTYKKTTSLTPKWTGDRNCSRGFEICGKILCQYSHWLRIVRILICFQAVFSCFLYIIRRTLQHRFGTIGSSIRRGFFLVTSGDCGANSELNTGGKLATSAVWSGQACPPSLYLSTPGVIEETTATRAKAQAKNANILFEWEVCPAPHICTRMQRARRQSPMQLSIQSDWRRERARGSRT